MSGRTSAHVDPGMMLHGPSTLLDQAMADSVAHHHNRGTATRAAARNRAVIPSGTEVMPYLIIFAFALMLALLATCFF